MSKKIFVLYAEYAAYLHACLRKLVQLHGYEVHVVRYPLDKNAPFTLDDEKGITFYNRKRLSRNDIRGLYRTINPDAILNSGWIDKDYNYLAREFKRDGKMVVAVVDNQWIGSVKQRIFTVIGKYFLNRRFTHFWIPGITQFEYMRRVGIDPNKLLTGYYSADSDLFVSRYYVKSNIPKRFIYVGRLLDIKGTPTLLKAIEMVNMNGGNDWEFLIIGNGQYEDDVKKLAANYTNVSHKPFMQPQQLAKEVSSGGVFILPSNYDAWGVVVHEFALLGYPLILSSMVGSRSYFVTPGYNGFTFESENPKSLTVAIKKIMSLDAESLRKMSERSHAIGKTINTESWAARLVESIESHYLR